MLAGLTLGRFGRNKTIQLASGTNVSAEGLRFRLTERPSVMLMEVKWIWRGHRMGSLEANAGTKLRVQDVYWGNLIKEKRRHQRHTYQRVNLEIK